METKYKPINKRVELYCTPQCENYDFINSKCNYRVVRLLSMEPEDVEFHEICRYLEERVKK